MARRAGGIVAARRALRDQPWRKLPMTRKQLGLLLALGEMNISSQMHRGTAADLIDRLLADREAEHQSFVHADGSTCSHGTI